MGKGFWTTCKVSCVFFGLTNRLGQSIDWGKSNGNLGAIEAEQVGIGTRELAEFPQDYSLPHVKIPAEKG